MFAGQTGRTSCSNMVSKSEVGTVKLVGTSEVDM